MTAAGDTMFEQFVDALNLELAASSGTLRVDRVPAPDGTSVTLIDASGNVVGLLPDHVDAATIVAVEVILRDLVARSAAVG